MTRSAVRMSVSAYGEENFSEYEGPNEISPLLTSGVTSQVDSKGSMGPRGPMGLMRGRPEDDYEDDGREGRVAVLRTSPQLKLELRTSL
jgi:hypothetical protein